MPVNFHYCVYVIIFLVATLCGCSHPEPPIASGRVIARGVVTLDGQPLGWGNILFLNSDPARTPFEGQFPAAISRGEFEIEITPGTYRVEIRQFQSDDLQKSEGTPSDSVQTLPQKYNDESEFTAAVSDLGPNVFSFQLRTR